MKEKKTTAQKVAEMSQQQKSNVLRAGIIVDVLAIVLLVVAILLWLPSFQNARDALNDARRISDEITEKNEMIQENDERLRSMGIFHISELVSYDAADKAWDRVDEANHTMLVDGIIIFCVYLVFFVIACVFLKVKYPYYSDGVFFYLLFGKDKKTA